jgi:hypothetical protein
MKVFRASVSPWKGKKATINFYVRPKNRQRTIKIYTKPDLNALCECGHERKDHTNGEYLPIICRKCGCIQYKETKPENALIEFKDDDGLGGREKAELRMFAEIGKKTKPEKPLCDSMKGEYHEGEVWLCGDCGEVHSWETKPENACKRCGHNRKKHHIDRPNGNLIWCDGFRCICDKFIPKQNFASEQDKLEKTWRASEYEPKEPETKPENALIEFKDDDGLGGREKAELRMFAEIGKKTKPEKPAQSKEFLECLEEHINGKNVKTAFLAEHIKKKYLATHSEEVV